MLFVYSEGKRKFRVRLCVSHDFIELKVCVERCSVTRWNEAHCDKCCNKLWHKKKRKNICMYVCGNLLVSNLRNLLRPTQLRVCRSRFRHWVLAVNFLIGSCKKPGTKPCNKTRFAYAKCHVPYFVLFFLLFHLLLGADYLLTSSCENYPILWTLVLTWTHGGHVSMRSQACLLLGRK